MKSKHIIMCILLVLTVGVIAVHKTFAKDDGSAEYIKLRNLSSEVRAAFEANKFDRTIELADSLKSIGFKYEDLKSDGKDDNSKEREQWNTILCFRALAKSSLGRYNEAETDFEFVMTYMKNSSITIYISYANVLSQLGKTTKAIAILEKAVKLFDGQIDNGGMHMLLWNLQWYYYVAKEYKKAIEVGVKCSEINPNSTGPMYNTALAMLAIKDNENALRIFFKGLNSSFLGNDSEKQWINNSAIEDIKNYIKENGANNTAACMLFFLNKSLDNKESEKYNNNINLNFDKYLDLIDIQASGFLYIVASAYSVQHNMLAEKYLSQACIQDESLFEKSKDDSEFIWYYKMNGYDVIERFIREKKQEVKFVIQNSHNSEINSIAWNPDGNLFASADDSGIIKLWTRGGILLKNLEGTKKTLYDLSLTWSHDGNLLASGSMDGTIRLWRRDGLLIKVLEGHTESIEGLSWNPDGTILASGSSDKTVRLWKSDGSLIKVMEGHKSFISTVSWSPDGKTLASCSGDASIRLWSCDGSLIKELKGHKHSVDYIAWSPDGKILLSISRDKKIGFWNNDGEMIKIIDGYGEMSDHPIWNPAGNFFATCSSKDNRVILWKRDGSLFKILEGHNENVRCLAWSPDGKQLASGAWDDTIRIWRLDGTLINVLEGHEGSINGISWSPDGDLFIASHDDIGLSRSITLWDKDGKLVKKLRPYSGGIIDVALNSDGGMFITRSTDKIVRIWTKNLSLLSAIKNSDAFQWSPDGNKLIVRCAEKTIGLWDRNENSFKILDGNYGEITGLGMVWSPDGEIFASGASDKFVRLWGKDGSSIKVLKGHTDYIYSLSWSPDGNVLASSSGDRTIRLWGRDGHLIKIINLQEGPAGQILWSPNGKLFVSQSGYDSKFCSLWRSDGTLVKKLEGYIGGVNFTLWSPDGKFFASISREKVDGTFNGKIICLWRNDGSLVRVLEGHTWDVYNIAWSPDSQLLASCSNDETVRLWKTDGSLCKTLQGHEGFVFHVSWSPDGNLLASSSDDKTIRIWRKDGSLLKIFESHSDSVDALAWSIDGTRLISGSDDSTIKYWNVKTGECIATILGINSQDFISYTPDYYYRLSGDAVNAVAFVKKMRAYGFDQFDLRHNRPDIVLERIYPDEKDRTPEVKAEISRYKKYWEYRVAKNGFTTEQVSGTTKIHAPEILDIKLNGTPLDKADTTVKDKTISLSFKIRDEKDSNLNVIGYKIFVNGVPLYGQYIKRFDKPAKEQSVSDKITLSTVADVDTNPGDNKIEISGFTEDGVESSRETLYLRYDGADLNKKGNLYIVSFGVNDYTRGSGFESLTYASGDAQDIVNTFKLSGKEKYGEIITMLYTEKEVNRDTMKTVRDRLAKTNVNDTVIFFMSGHGVRADTDLKKAAEIAKYFDISYTIGDITDDRNMTNIYYYMTGDSDGSKPWEKGIPMDAIRYALDGIPARQKLLLIDTCQSGEKPELSGYTPSAERLAEVRSKGVMLANGKKEKGVKLVRRGVVDKKGIEITSAIALDMKEMSDMFPELRRGTGTIEISAATGVQSALESSKWKNGAFTYVVKEGIVDGKAKDKAGKITAKSLRSYVLSRVEELTGGDQTPMVCRDIAGRDFEVGR